MDGADCQSLSLSVVSVSSKYKFMSLGHSGCAIATSPAWSHPKRSGFEATSLCLYVSWTRAIRLRDPADMPALFTRQLVVKPVQSSRVHPPPFPRSPVSCYAAVRKALQRSSPRYAVSTVLRPTATAQYRASPSASINDAAQPPADSIRRVAK